MPSACFPEELWNDHISKLYGMEENILLLVGFEDIITKTIGRSSVFRGLL
jgi:hypothetical protein